jgi:hypothetical protein
MELAQKHRLFMSVLRMSNLTRSQQMSFRACFTKLHASLTLNHPVYKVIKTLCSATRDPGRI